ncbi:hypothetical protein Tco_0278871, partial [Tanacetum coccineum]
PTSQTSPESSNGQPSPVSTTSIPTPPPPPPPPITRQRPVNLRQNPKQRVPYNPFANQTTILPTTITEPTSFTVANNSSEWRQAMKEEYDCNTPKLGCSGIRVRGVLLLRSLAQDIY